MSEYAPLATSRDAIDLLTAISEAISGSTDSLTAAIAIIEELEQRNLVIVRALPTEGITP